ncbi:2-phospho-L-lactate guanylyltransferase [Nocardioides albus]|uniref:2-phospho-L-lactate guanylyltransferase n=1 Tax=Nocardioides albus TaxID=1841 RepID=A0A7W5A638_9ACTN|nr:2-phospho-L-lactate guanylyltransferase [Nocardioides albus]MBB3090124.1 2-phospho-L-lactate guanylyltransferase [Nocardioides albus]GGU27847.1 2-phospho-L-lactate guanylyltransferase [Nocardioides albus]
MPAPAPGYVVLLPVKPPARGKSRLVGIESHERADLARSFALDTAESCLTATRVGAVLVITDDSYFAADVVRLGADVIPDGVSGDLNETLVQGAREARRRWPGLRPAALCGDLPALRAADLDAALAATEGSGAAYVEDAAGGGTTLYTAPHDLFRPAFGPGSAAAHGAGGARPVEGALSSLRHDVDTLEDLEAVRRLGLGPRTTLASVRVGSSG